MYTNYFFTPKKFSTQSLKKRSLFIAKCLINQFRKFNKEQKTFTLEIRKKLLCKRQAKTIFVLYLPFAINLC